MRRVDDRQCSRHPDPAPCISHGSTLGHATDRTAVFASVALDGASALTGAPSCFNLHANLGLPRRLRSANGRTCKPLRPCPAPFHPTRRRAAVTVFRPTCPRLARAPRTSNLRIAQRAGRAAGSIHRHSTRTIMMGPPCSDHRDDGRHPPRPAWRATAGTSSSFRQHRTANGHISHCVALADSLAAPAALVTHPSTPTGLCRHRPPAECRNRGVFAEVLVD